LRPTSSISTREPAVAAAATIQNAADEKSPGTVSERLFGVIAGPRNLGDRRRACGSQAGEENRALQLGAGHRRPVGNRVQGCAVDDERRVSIGRVDARAHLLERRGDPSHRPPGKRGVADHSGVETLSRKDAGQ
jgi:hypothetical protein